MRFDNLFPTIIGVSNYSDHNKQEKKVVNHLKKISKTVKSGGGNWIAKNTYNTLNTYDILNDDVLKPINQFVFNSVKNYVTKLEVSYNNKNYDVVCINGWFNIYNKGDYQEYHNHTENTISAIYFLKSDEEKNARVWFESPIPDRVNDLRSNTNRDLQHRVYYKAKPGTLLVFDSSQRHSVEQEQIGNRISLAYNFNIEMVK